MHPPMQALIGVREGEYRFVSQRLVTHAEEVAFYDGIRRERSIIQHAFARLLGALGWWGGVGGVMCGPARLCPVAGWVSVSGGLL